MRHADDFPLVHVVLVVVIVHVHEHVLPHQVPHPLIHLDLLRVVPLLIRLMLPHSGLAAPFSAPLHVALLVAVAVHVHVHVHAPVLHSLSTALVLPRHFTPFLKGHTPHSLPLIDVVIAGISLQALVDTGSSISLLSKSVFNSLSPANRPVSNVPFCYS